MEGREPIRILFIAGFGPIVRDRCDKSQAVRRDPRHSLQRRGRRLRNTEALKGAKASRSGHCRKRRGHASWPGDVPVPHAWLEFDVDDVEQATAQLESRGHRILVKNKKEPWGQTVSRFLDPEGLLVGVTFTPFMREAAS